MPFETPGATTQKPFQDPPSSRHYRAADGSFVPSVTTIIGVMSKDGLWTGQEGGRIAEDHSPVSWGMGLTPRRGTKKEERR